MAGKRILDATALFNASRSVAQKHVALRSKQLGEFNQTSSIAKAVRNQTDRVTVTLQAANALASRLNEDPPTYTSTSSVANFHDGDGELRRAQKAADKQQEVQSQVDRHEDKPISTSDRARQQQRQAEFQIPSQTAKPSTHSQETQLSEDHDKDVFYERTEDSSPSLSALPRVKIPKKAEDTQGSSEKVKDGQMNPDTFYSSEGHIQAEQIPKSEAVPDQKHLPEGINTDVFHSPRVAKMLTGKSPKGSKAKGLELGSASQTPVDKTGLGRGQDQASFNVRQSSQARPTAPETNLKAQEIEQDHDIQLLAKDIEQDAKASASETRDEELGPQQSGSSFQMNQSRVPSTRFGRIWQYGTLATSMAFGAVGESFRRATGSDSQGSLMLSSANMDRLVAKLSRMRGAALKLGQMLSFQDSRMLPEPISQVLARVQDSADFMPVSQRDSVLASNLGSDWRELFSSFSERPMAAASIGQVHSATLAEDGARVAVKIQYPGVARSIDSDLNNLSLLLTASRLLPAGLYLDKTIANARVELAWECDYVREADCVRRFQSLLADDTETFRVPRVIDSACGPQVLTMSYMSGWPVAKAPTKPLSQQTKDWIATQIMRLCLREIGEFRFMQTDPNWTNFLYNSHDHKIELLDFGASREYPAKFVEPYLRILAAGARGDEQAVKNLSLELGYLTGAESAAMTRAHVQSVVILAEPFRRDSPPGGYSFAGQDVTDRIRALIPLMIRERLAPPPEETYSLHRKLSGAFLLGAKLNATVDCRKLFVDTMTKAGIEV